jgi:hypothetical protein
LTSAVADAIDAGPIGLLLADRRWRSAAPRAAWRDAWSPLETSKRTARIGD